MQGNGEYSAGLPDRALWQQSQATDAVEDEAERFLDLAGFADGRLDADDHERVAHWLAGDPDATADVASVRDLAAYTDAPPASVVTRACTLVGGAMVIAFRPRGRPALRLAGLAQWGSLAAAIVIAGWLGFTLGMDTTQSFDRTSATTGEESPLHDLLDPSTGFLRDLTSDTQT